MSREIDPLKRQDLGVVAPVSGQDGRVESGPATAQRIENCLRAMIAVMSDRAVPLPVRDQICLAHRKLHACRDELTVRRMERDKGLRK